MGNIQRDSRQSYFNAKNISEELSNEIKALSYEFESIQTAIEEKGKQAGRNSKEIENQLKAAAERYKTTLEQADLVHFEQKKKEYAAEKALKEWLLAETEEDSKKAEKKYRKAAEDLQKYKDKLEDISLTKSQKKKKDKEKKLTEELEKLKDKIAQGTATEDEEKAYKKLQKEKDFEEKGKLSVENLNLENLGKQLTNVFAASLNKLTEFGDNAVKDAEGIATQYRSKVTNRLYGSGKDFLSTETIIENNLAISTLVKTKDVLSNLNTAVNDGIAYNVEQRAFIQTVKEQIVDTFNAFDSNLTRLIRIQNEDSTAARLGLESKLQELFNKWFEDTSYLSDAFDTATGNLVEASALLSSAQATEFEYVAQKWLGALYEAGASSDLISTISKGLGYLGSGNYQGLTSDTGIMSLLAVSAGRTNKLNITDMLSKGLDASELNTLMKSMVGYLQEIATSTNDNNVVRSAFGNVFSFSTSDIEAVNNLTTMMDTIYSTEYSTQDLMNYAESRVQNLWETNNFASQLATLMENLEYSTGSNIVNTSGIYMTYKALDVIEKLTGGIDIPSVFGTQIGTTVAAIGKAAIAGVSALSAIIGGANSEGGIKASLNGWDAKSSRSIGGEGLNIKTTTGSTTHSQVTSGGGAADALAQEGKDSQKDIEELYGDQDEDSIDLEKLYDGFFIERGSKGVLSNLNKIIASSIEDNCMKVKVINSELPLTLSTDSKNAISSALNNIEQGLGVGASIDDNSIKNLLLKMSNTVGTDTNAINVNLKKSEVGIQDLAGIGAKVTRLNIGV